MDESCQHMLDDHGRLRPELVEDLLIEVISGRSLFEVRQQLYASRSPTLIEQERARIIYARYFHDYRNQGLLTREQLEHLALDKGFITQQDRDEQESLTALMQSQAKARDTSTDNAQKVELLVEMEKVQGRILELQSVEDDIFRFSAEDRADGMRLGYIISCCTMGGTMLETPVWPGWPEYLACNDHELLGLSRQSQVRVLGGLPITIIRAIARTELWRSRWRAAKESGAPLFPGSSTDWDANRRNLIWWSDFYESIRRHPTPPSETVLGDDKMLQAWINTQVSRQRQGGAAPGPQRRPPTYTDGRGQKHEMVAVGSQTIDVRQPYKIRPRKV